jgi:hypothetical protein
MNASLMSNGTILGIDLGKYKSVVGQSDWARRAGGAFEYRRRFGYIGRV